MLPQFVDDVGSYLVQLSSMLASGVVSPGDTVVFSWSAPRKKDCMTVAMKVRTSTLTVQSVSNTCFDGPTNTQALELFVVMVREFAAFHGLTLKVPQKALKRSWS
jgi:hypothetical protein